MINYRKTVLPSGVRVCSENIPAALSTVIGIYIIVGSRDENDNCGGISHFIEHSVFKGTENRTEREISLEIESRGGTINASTSREWTSFYAHVLPEETERALDVLTDIITNPLFEEDSIEREKRVILEEIKQFYDSPESLLFLNALRSTFGEEHPLSKPIFGTVRSVKKITVKDIINFWKSMWVRDRIYVSAVGNVNHDELCEQIEKRFPGKKGNGFSRKSHGITKEKINIVEKSELNHEYVAISRNTFTYDNDDRLPFLVGSSILGSGMSSRLFRKLRQEESLVYHVSNFNEFFSDTGIFGVYLSTDASKLQKTLDLTGDIMRNLNFSREEFKVAKERIKGNIVIFLEDNANRMVRNVKEEIYRGRRTEIDALLKDIEEIKLEDAVHTAEKYLNPDNFALTVLGRSKDVSW